MRHGAKLLLALCILPAAGFAQAIAHDYSALYEAVSPAVVQITTDDATGSGFLVTPFGHIATNFHVIRGARYLAVQFPNGRKVKAVVAAVNPRYDMAVLKVNSEVVDGITPLRVLAEEKETSIKVGIPVVAIGSPLNQKFLMTQGILSKVDEAIVMGDFLLQAGNSGGPLLNVDGEVVALNTFGEGNIGGAIRVSALRLFLNSPELLAESMFAEPPPEQLRSISAERYPVDVLNQKIESEALDMDAYKFKAGNFTVTTVTPVLIAKLHASRKKQKPGANQQNGERQDVYTSTQEPYYEWHRSTESSLDYVVIFDVRPDSVPTKRGVGSRIPSVLKLGKKSKQQDMEFKGDFLELRIYRDGELIEPIMPGRQVIEETGVNPKDNTVDRAYAGSYIYSPDEFLKGGEFRMQIIDARNPNEVHKEIVFPADSKLIKQLRSDFSVPAGRLVTQAP